MITALTSLFELSGHDESKRKKPLSTLAFDWLYVILSILLTVGIMMDVWSHMEYGPDQSIFNEYHLLFYGSMTAILALLVGLHTVNVGKGFAWAHALPQGYGLGLLATLLFGVSGMIDLTGHALFGFESDIEALTSPTHLLLFINWFLILFAPVRAARARIAHNGQPQTLMQSLPMFIAYGCMVVTFTIPLMEYFPMGSEPYMLHWLRPEDDSDGLVMGIAGTLFQTIIYMSFTLWLARHFRLPLGSYTITFLILGLFLTLINDWQQPWAMFGLFGIALDVLYLLLQPDAQRRSAYVAFAMLGALAMWGAFYATLFYFFGGQYIYFSGYNLLGSVAQATVLSGLAGWLMSMPMPSAQFAPQEVSHA